MKGIGFHLKYKSSYQVVSVLFFLFFFCAVKSLVEGLLERLWSRQPCTAGGAVWDLAALHWCWSMESVLPVVLHLSDFLIAIYAFCHLLFIRKISPDCKILKISSREQHLFICEGEQAPAWKDQAPEAEKQTQKSLAQDKMFADGWTTSSGRGVGGEQVNNWH